MCTVLIECDPNLCLRIPASETAHEATDVGGVFAATESPMHFAATHVVEQEEIKETARLLLARQDGTLFPRPAITAIGLDRDGFDIKEKQHAVFREVAQRQAQATQD